MVTQQPTNADLLNMITEKFGKVNERFDKVDTKLEKVKDNIQKDIKRIGEIVVTKTDLEALKTTVNNLPDKSFIDDRITKLKEDVTGKREAMKKAVLRIAEIFAKGNYLEEVDRKDIKVVKEELEEALQ